MEIKSVIRLSNIYKYFYLKEKLNFFGGLFGLIFNYNEYNDCYGMGEIVANILEGKIDCAIIDAKSHISIESEYFSDLDWFWIPLYSANDSDILVSRSNDQNTIPRKIGVISSNEWLYCKKLFKSAQIEFLNEFKSIDKLLKIFDLVMLPLFFYKESPEFNIKKISIVDMKKPIWEGASCIVFKKGDERFENLRRLFAKSVYFIGAGIGSAKFATCETIRTIKNIDVCLFDNLMDHSLLDYLPENVILIDVGKRCEHHKVKQSKITDLIGMYARMGFRVGRLKGGDPSIFGRLAEEIKVLEDLKMNYNVLPGISTLNALAIKSGIVLTRREINRGFCVLSAIKHKGHVAEFSKKELEEFPLVFFMGIRVIDKIVKSLINDGYAAQTNVAVVFSVGTGEELEVKGTLFDIAEKINYLRKQIFFDNPPGIFVVGKISNFHYNRNGFLQDKKVLLVQSSDDSLYFNFKDFGAEVSNYNFEIKYSVNKQFLEQMITFDAIAIDQLSLARAIIAEFIINGIDIRKMPRIITFSDEVKKFYARYGLQSVESLDYIKNSKIGYISGYKRLINNLEVLSDNNNNVIEMELSKEIFGPNKLENFDIIYFKNLEDYFGFIDLNEKDALKDKLILCEDKEVFLKISKLNISNRAFHFKALNFNESLANSIIQ